MHTYIEILAFKDDSCIKRVDVTNKGERMIEKIDNGMNINLNHGGFYTKTTESETPLELEPVWPVENSKE